MGVATAVALLAGSTLLTMQQQRAAGKKQEKAAKRAADAQEAALDAQIKSQQEVAKRNRVQEVADPYGGGRAIIGADAVSALSGSENINPSRTRVVSSVGGLGSSGVQV